MTPVKYPRSALFALVVAIGITLSACSDKTPPAVAATPTAVAPEALSPTDPRLADLYERSCKACHTQSGGVTPLTGDVQAWQLRLAKGLPALLGSVRQGFNGMPADGLCAECTDADLQQLIAFMSQTEVHP